MHTTELGEIMSWDTFNADNFRSNEELDEWIRDKRAKVLYRDESYID